MQALVHHSGSGLDDLAPEVMLEVVQHMGPDDKRSWRLVNRAACKAVYEGTTALSARPAAFRPFRMSDTCLPLPLLGKCSGLKRLFCQGLHSFRSLHGLPPALEVLDISQTAVTDLSPLEQCTGLRRLMASDPLRWDIDDAIQQLPHIRPLTAIQHLELRSFLLCVTAAEAAEASQALALTLEQLTGLQHLNLEGNRLDAGDAETLAPAIQKLTGLQHLSMRYNWMGSEGAQALAPAIQQLSRLRHLDMGGNGFGDEGAQALAPAIQELTGLRHLGIAENKLGAVGALALAPAVQQLSRLRHLDLGNSGLGVGGAQALAPAIQQLCDLQHVDLGDNGNNGNKLY